MQAHPLSSPAARIPELALLPGPVSPTQPSIANGAGLAHDAGNLLGALGLYCDLLDAPGVLRPEHTHYARELRLLSQRSQALIRRLLYGADDAPAGPLRCPRRTVTALLPLLRSIAAPCHVVARFHAALPPLPFSPEILERILVNLTRNAATALASQPAAHAPTITFELTYSTAAHTLRLTVADNGPGMSSDLAAQFLHPRPLSPGETSRLGHRIVHQLLVETGGTLEVSAARNRSTSLHMDWRVPAPESERTC